MNSAEMTKKLPPQEPSIPTNPYAEYLSSTNTDIKAVEDVGSTEMTDKSLSQQSRKPANPYAKYVSTKAPSSQEEETTTLVMPQKRTSSNLNIMNPSLTRKKDLPRSKAMSMLVEGYAFEDDIIGVCHRKINGEEAFNMTLRKMIVDHKLDNDGFTAWVVLRDKSSGKEDKQLLGKDGYPKYLFLSINVHQFQSIEDANEPVLEQCRKMHTVRILYKESRNIYNLKLTKSCIFLYQVVTNPTHNVFAYKYLPITSESNKTGSKLLALSDLATYSDTFRIMSYIYGDKSHIHKLPSNFGTKYPHVVAKYFPNTDDLPDLIRKELAV